MARRVTRFPTTPHSPGHLRRGRGRTRCQARRALSQLASQLAGKLASYTRPVAERMPSIRAERACARVSLSPGARAGPPTHIAVLDASAGRSVGAPRGWLAVGSPCWKVHQTAICVVTYVLRQKTALPVPAFGLTSLASGWWWARRPARALLRPPRRDGGGRRGATRTIGSVRTRRSTTSKAFLLIHHRYRWLCDTMRGYGPA